MSDPLVELLRSEACGPLRQRLRKKIEWGESLSGKCRFTKLTRSQKTAISELTGASGRGSSVSVDLNLFTKVVVNTGRFDSLEALVRLACDEPIRNRRKAKETDTAQWAEVWQHAEQLTQCLSRSAESRDDEIKMRPVAGQPFTPNSVRDAIVAMRQSGWLRRITSRNASQAFELFDEAFAILHKLPTHPIPLPVFAAKHCGNAHALDDNANLGRVILKLVAPGHSNEKPRKKAVRRRRIWEGVGIVTDELSTTVLALNLSATGQSLTDRLLQDHLLSGMPVRLTFRHLRLHPPTFKTPNTVTKQRIYVCENPSILAEATNRLGSFCPPLICVEGHPSLACWILLGKVCESGFQLAYHGDFDWGGVRIANKIYEAFGFEPWRFTSPHYQIRSKRHQKLRPPAAESAWDQTLAQTIRQGGLSIEEESMIEELLADLSGSSQS